MGLLLSAAPATVKAQLEYTINAGTITITGYSGHGGALAIPDTIRGLAVTGIGPSAFNSTALNSVSIPGSVTSIGAAAFENCSDLTNATISMGVSSIESNTFANCSSLTSVTIPSGVTSIGNYAFFDCNLTSVTIPNSVTSIGNYAFSYCNPTSVTIPGSVTSIGADAFWNCFSLSSVFFQGNAPTVGFDGFFHDANSATAYYLPGTTGWSSPFAGLPAVLWKVAIQTNSASFGVASNSFGFNITGTTNVPIVVEACTNLANAMWTPLLTLTLTNGLFYFSEPLQTNNTGRYYRISSP
jgi:hypothetical protein